MIVVHSKTAASISLCLTGLAIYHPAACSGTVFQIKAFSCTSRVVISFFVQQCLNAIDYIV